MKIRDRRAPAPYRQSLLDLRSVTHGAGPALVLGLATLLFAGCAGAFFGKAHRDFIQVADITQVPESDPFTMRDVRIEDDSLKFIASYGGGCREHVFTLYASSAEKENAAWLYVQHNGNNDLCRAVVNADSVAFSLKGLKSALNLKGRARLSFSPAMTALDSGVTLTY